jgi:hypothetical protein
METIYLENADLMSVLHCTRDKVHAGHKLLTHPLTGSVKPNQTPYKSIVISKGKNALDMESLKIIEGSIQTAGGQMSAAAPPQAWPEKLLKDFQLIDLDLITSGIHSIVII